MKVIIRVTRKTEYASLVDMPQEDYDRLNTLYESESYADNKKASKELNDLIDVHDWQDDELLDVEEFEPWPSGEEEA